MGPALVQEGHTFVTAIPDIQDKIVMWNWILVTLTLVKMGACAPLSH